MGAWTDDRSPPPEEKKLEEKEVQEDEPIEGSWTAGRLGGVAPTAQPIEPPEKLASKREGVPGPVAEEIEPLIRKLSLKARLPTATPEQREGAKKAIRRLSSRFGEVKQKRLERSRRHGGRKLGVPGLLGVIAGLPSQALEKGLELPRESYERWEMPRTGKAFEAAGRGLAYATPVVGQTLLYSDVAATGLKALEGDAGPSDVGGSVGRIAALQWGPKLAGLVARRFGADPSMVEAITRRAAQAGTAYVVGSTAVEEAAKTYRETGEVTDALLDGLAAGAGMGVGLAAGRGGAKLAKKLAPQYKEPVRYRDPLRKGGRERAVRPPPIRRPKERKPYKVRFEKRPYDPLALERGIRKKARVQEEAERKVEEIRQERIQQEKLRHPRARPLAREPIETATEPSEPGKLKLWTTRGKPTPTEPKPTPSRPGKLTLWDTGVKPKPRAKLQPAELPGRRAKDIAAYWAEGKRAPLEIPTGGKPAAKPTIKLPPVKSGKLTELEKRHVGEAMAQIAEKGPRNLADAERRWLGSVIQRRGTEIEGGEATRIIRAMEQVVPEPAKGPIEGPTTSGGTPLKKPLEPAIVRTDKKLLSRIHITRKSQKIPDATFRAAVAEATGGRTESTKALSSEEARFVLSSLKVEPPTGRVRKAVKPSTVLRKPTAEAVAEEKAGIIQAVGEVKTYAGQKFPEVGGAPKKPSLLTRLKRSWPGQIVGISSKNASYETKVELASGKRGKTYNIMVEQQREGRRKAQASANSSQDVTLQEMKRHKITGEHVRSWGEKQETFHLTSGRKLKISPAEAAKIVQLGMDPEVRAGMHKWGVTFREVGEPIKVSTVDQRILATELRTRHPSLGRFIDFTFKWMNGPGAQQVANTYEQETGKSLPISGKYANSLRDIRHLRGTKAASMSEEAQYDRAVQEITNRLGYKAKGKAAEAPPGGPKLKGYRPPGELRHLPILKERVAAKAPYRINDLFVDFFAHRNRVANYSGKAVGIRNAQLLLNDKGFQKAMRQGFRDGEIRMADMRKHLQAFKGLDVMSKDTLDRATSGILRRATVGMLGLKPQIIAYQPISYLNALTEIPAKYLISKEALDLGLGTRKLTLAEIKKFGPELRARFEGTGHLIMTPSLTQAMGRQVETAYGMKPKGVLKRIGKGAEQVGMFGIRKSDQATMMRIWRASKAWARADGFKGAELLQETNRRTMRAADRTQPTWDPLTISTLQLEARTSPLKKVMVLFTSQSGKNFNMAVRAVDEFAHTRKGTPGRYANLIKGVGIPIVVNATMVYGVGQGMRKVYGYSMDDKSYVDHIGGVLDRAVGGWIPMGGFAADLRKMVTESLGDKAKIFIEPRHNVLVEAGDQAMQIIPMAIELLQKRAKQARTGRLRDEEVYERAIERAMPQIMRATATWTGLPVGGAAQASKLLQPAKLKR